MQTLIPYLVIGSLVILYIVTYLLNKRTAIPQECITDFDAATCHACHNFSCSHHGGDN